MAPLWMYEIDGGRPLVGRVPISGSKNASLPILTAALLASSPSVIHQVPRLRDTVEMIKLLEYVGAECRWEGNTVHIDPTGLKAIEVPYEIMRRMRASFYAMGPMLARLGRARVSLPGGCAIGTRPVDLHLKGFKALGAQLNQEAGYVRARHFGLTGTKMNLSGTAGSSVGATCNVMMAATLADGCTVIEGAAMEPDVIDLGQYLRAMGAVIGGLGTPTITIEGVSELKGTEYTVMPDRIEAGTWAVAALATGGDITLENVDAPSMCSTLEALRTWGAEITAPERGCLRVTAGERAPHPVHVMTEPFPGFPTDMQSVLTVLLAVTPGESSIIETIYPDRWKHVPELNRMGASIRIDRSRAVITGVPKLDGAAVMSSDLRAGAALVLASLVAEGRSQVRRIYHIERGYERLEAKLMGLGAGVRRLPESDVDPGLDLSDFTADEMASQPTIVTG